MHLAIAGLVSVALLLGPPPGKGPKDKDKHKGKPGAAVVVFDRDQHAAWTSWSKGRGCPPGLAKKNNGCLPPGQAKKRYVVGQKLPVTVRWEPLPRDLRDVLGPAPRGYEYGLVDGDVLKLAVGTRLVVDALQAILD